MLQREQRTFGTIPTLTAAALFFMPPQNNNERRRLKHLSVAFLSIYSGLRLLYGNLPEHLAYCCFKLLVLAPEHGSRVIVHFDVRFDLMILDKALLGN